MSWDQNKHIFSSEQLSKVEKNQSNCLVTAELNSFFKNATFWPLFPRPWKIDPYVLDCLTSEKTQNNCKLLTYSQHSEEMKFKWSRVDDWSGKQLWLVRFPRPTPSYDTSVINSTDKINTAQHMTLGDQFTWCIFIVNRFWISSIRTSDKAAPVENPNVLSALKRSEN